MTLSQGLYKRKYNRMFIAVLLGWIVTIIGETGDTLIAGIFIGDTAVAGLELAAPVYNMQYFLASIFALGGAVLFGRDIGNNDKESAEKHVGMLVIIGVIVSIIGFFIMSIIEKAYFTYFTDNIEMLEHGYGYYNGLRIMQLFYPLYWIFYNFVSADGDDRAILYADITSAVLNIVINIVLAQKMGAFGIGLGTALSLFISSAFLFAHLFKKNNNIKFRPYFNLKELLPVFAYGSNTSLSSLYLAVLGLVFNKFIIETIGERYIAVFSVASFALETANVAFSGINAAEPFIAVSVGERNPQAQRKVAKAASKYTFITGIIIAVGFLIIAPYFPAWYDITEPDLYELGSFTLRAMGLSMIIGALGYEFSEYYSEIDHYLLGNLASLFRSLVGPIIIAIPMSLLWGYKGIVIGLCVVMIVSVVGFALIVRIRFGKKSFPYLIAENEDMLFNEELAVNNEEIALLLDKCENVLKNKSFSFEVINNIRLILEELLMTILDNNKGKKVFAECMIIHNENALSVSIKDDGKLFNMTDRDNPVVSFRSYIVSSLIGKASNKAYIATVSFNKNSFDVPLKTTECSGN